MGLESVANVGLWGGFIVFVLAMLALDLGVFHRKTHAIGYKEALIWSVVWVSLALVFNGGIWWFFGSEPAIEFLTGYLIEKSLSADNIFVFVVIFSALGIPLLHQHRVLFWGILTALGLRAAMIFAGTAMLARFHWLIYVFGGFLLVTGVRLFWHRNDELNPEESLIMRLCRRVIPSTSKLAGSQFFTVENGRRVATPLFLALVLVEVSDVIFALDSIPAIFAITVDPFLVFTSNIFAILGLRSLFFLLAGLVQKFRYLKVGLAAVLVFVGAKMLVMDFYKVPPVASLLVIAALIGSSIVASMIVARGQSEDAGHASLPEKTPSA
jgi:tellurite resistance protein TerC